MPEPREVKVFRASVPDPEAQEMLPFELEFTYPDGRSVAHQFSAVGNPGAGADLALTSIVRWNHQNKQIVDLNGMLTFFDRVMPPNDFARLSALLEDRELSIPMDTIAEVFAWLVEEYTGRPTQRSSDSSAGPRATGVHLMASPSPMVSTSQS